MSDENKITCPSCNTPYFYHLGLNGTCAKLQEIFALVEANRHYTDPQAFEMVCEKIMELKKDPK